MHPYGIMVGSASSPPLWAGNDWRPILGTSVDTRILPPPLSDKESLLPVSGFACPVMTCILGMLPTAGYSLAKSTSALGPDCDDSPHSIRELPLDLGTPPYIAMLFGSEPVNTGTYDHALLITYLLKSMSVVSQLALTVAFAFFTSCGTCLMSKWEVFWVALLFLRHYYMGSSPTTVPGSW